jgi:hypothetical protein
MFYDEYCRWIKDRCTLRGIPCEVVSGVSTFDAVFSRMKIDLLGGEGVQAGDLLYFERNPPDPGSYALLFRPVKYPEKLKKILRRCLRRYPPAHRVAFVRCAGAASVPERIDWCSMKTCAGRAGELDGWTSLLIPPVRR